MQRVLLVDAEQRVVRAPVPLSHDSVALDVLVVVGSGQAGLTTGCRLPIRDAMVALRFDDPLVATLQPEDDLVVGRAHA